MLPINNSDTAWLIVCDYNQDNNFLYEDLREDVLNPEINQWLHEFFEFSHNSVGGNVDGIGNLAGFESIGFERSGGIIGHTLGQWVGGELGS